MTRERREVARIPVSLEARWKGFSGRGTAQVSNFSTVGCYLETLENIANREVVEVEIRMPSGEWLRLMAQVVYHIPQGGFGLFFVEVSEKMRRFIGQIVERYGEDVASATAH